MKSIKGGSEMEEDANIREKGEVDSTCECQGITPLVPVYSNGL